jgi:hypothetical protein
LLKTEPKFILPQRTTALPNQVQLVDLTGDSSDSDDSFLELSEVVSHVTVKEEKVKKEVVIEPEPTGHKREGSLSTSQPPGNTIKRSKPAAKTRSVKVSKRTKPKRQASPSIVLVGEGNSKGEESEEGEEEGEGLGLGIGLGEGEYATLTQQEATLWEKLDELGEQSEEEENIVEEVEGEESEGELGRQTKSGRRVHLPQRFAD